MAEPLEVRVCDLLTKFFTNTLVLFCAFQTAGTIPPSPPEALLDRHNHFFIFIQPNCHINTSLPKHISKNSTFAGGIFGGVRGI